MQGQIAGKAVQNRQTPGVIEFTNGRAVRVRYTPEHFPNRLWEVPVCSRQLEGNTDDVEIFVGPSHLSDVARFGIVIVMWDGRRYSEFCPIHERDLVASFRGMLLVHAHEEIQAKTLCRCYLAAARRNEAIAGEIREVIGVETFDAIMATDPPELAEVYVRYRKMGVDLTPKPRIRPDLARLYART